MLPLTLTQLRDDLLGVDDAGDMARGVNHGQRAQVVFVEELGDLGIAGVHTAVDSVAFAQHPKAGIAVGEEKAWQHDYAVQLFLVIEDIDFRDGVGIALEVSKGFDGFGNAGIAWNADEVGGHAAGSGFSGEFEQLLDVLTLLRFHLFEDLFGLLLAELGEHVGGGTGVHLLDDVCGALGIHALKEFLLNLWLNLFERFGGGLLGKAGENGLALGGCEFFEDVRDVRRVQLGEAFLAYLEADAARGIAVDDVDAAPGDESRRDTVHDAVDGARGQPLQQPASGAAESDFDVLDEQGGGVTGWTILCPGKVDVVDAHDLAAIDIDDLLVEQVAFEQQCVAEAGDRMGRRVGAQALVRDARRFKVLDGDHEALSLALPTLREQQSGDAIGVLADIDCEFLNTAQAATGGIHDLFADEHGNCSRIGRGVLHDSFLTLTHPAGERIARTCTQSIGCYRAANSHRQGGGCAGAGP